MRVLGHMCVKNEGSRYLDSSLSLLEDNTNDIFVWDDNSEDDTQEILSAHGVAWDTKPANVPTFVDAEGSFREAGWERMLEVLRPDPGDWIVVLDADEFLVPPSGRLFRLAEWASTEGYESVIFKIHEIFAVDPVRERVDGYWGSTLGTRLALYREDLSQHFRSKKMASGVLPAYAHKGRCWTPTGMRILHFGYAMEEDRKAKYERYTTFPDGHSGHHIKSILKKPTLKEWDGFPVNWWRGRRCSLS